MTIPARERSSEFAAAKNMGGALRNCARLHADNVDQEFAFRVKHAALGTYVDRVWGWDHAFQQQFHAADWAVNRPSIITYDGEAIGTLEVVAHADHLYVGEFYLLPQWQRQGLGSELLRDVMSRAAREHLPVRLQFLKINPVRSLYERFGFRVVGETETHFLAEFREPDGSAAA